MLKRLLIALAAVVLCAPLVFARTFPLSDYKLEYDVPETWELAPSRVITYIKDCIANPNPSGIIVSGPSTKYDFRLQLWLTSASQSPMRNPQFGMGGEFFGDVWLGVISVQTIQGGEPLFREMLKQEELAEYLEEYYGQYEENVVTDYSFTLENGKREITFKIETDIAIGNDEYTRVDYQYYKEFDGSAIIVRYTDKDSFFNVNMDPDLQTMLRSFRPYKDRASNILFVMLGIGALGVLLIGASIANKMREKNRAPATIDLGAGGPATPGAPRPPSPAGGTARVPAPSPAAPPPVQPGPVGGALFGGSVPPPPPPPPPQPSAAGGALFGSAGGTSTGSSTPASSPAAPPSAAPASASPTSGGALFGGGSGGALFGGSAPAASSGAPGSAPAQPAQPPASAPKDTLHQRIDQLKPKEHEGTPIVDALFGKKKRGGDTQGPAKPDASGK